MGDYFVQRIVRLNEAGTEVELERLAASGFVELQRWIPGVKHVWLIRSSRVDDRLYILNLTFTDYNAYLSWRQVDEDGIDYWERYAAIQHEWADLCHMVAESEYTGEVVVDANLGREARG